MCMSGLWRDEHLARAPNLRFVQSISAGINNFGQDAFRARGVRLASAQGANAIAVAEHAMALMLALNRLMPASRDNQAKAHWRGMIANPAARERELNGQVLLIIGLGGIGQRLAGLATAFGMRVIGTRSDPIKGAGSADAVYADTDLLKVLPQADVIALTCPLTPATANLINATAIAVMRPGVSIDRRSAIWSNRMCGLGCYFRRTTANIIAAMEHAASVDHAAQRWRNTSL
jgi:phosphoglycerate dehydrogenase-like enzyme